MTEYGMTACVQVVELASWRASGMVMIMTHISSPHAVSIVYVGNAESNEIVVRQLERRTGDLKPIERMPIPNVVQLGISTPMAVSPDRRFLYVGVRGQPQSVASFAINPTSGRLTYVASGPLA